MNRNRDNRSPSSEGDSVLAAEYRAIATQRTPKELDARVLAKADAATRTGIRGFMPLWYRPLAFAATLVLSLAIIFELTSIQLPEPAVSPASEARRNEPAARLDAPRVTDDLRKSAVLSADKPQEIVTPAPAKASAPEQTNASADEKSISADFASMIEASSPRRQGRDPVTETAIQSLQQTKAGKESRAESIASAAVPSVVTRPCSAEQVADPMKWRICIGELEESGRYDEAKAELDLFNEAYPESELSAPLPSE